MGRPSVFKRNEKILEEILTLPEGESVTIDCGSFAAAYNQRSSLYYTFKKAAFDPDQHPRYAHLKDHYTISHTVEQPHSIIIIHNKAPIIRRRQAKRLDKTQVQAMRLCKDAVQRSHVVDSFMINAYTVCIPSDYTIPNFIEVLQLASHTDYSLKRVVHWEQFQFTRHPEHDYIWKGLTINVYHLSETPEELIDQIFPGIIGNPDQITPWSEDALQNCYSHLIPTT